MRRLLFLSALAAGLLALLAAPAFASAKTFYVPATGGDNTAAIQAAFNRAVAAGSGSVVQLGPGHFYTDAIFVSGFNGTFRGAGQGVTTIDTLRGFDNGAAPLGPVTLDKAGNTVVSWPALFCFAGGNVRVCDMTAAISDPSPAAQWNTWGVETTALGDVFEATRTTSAAFSDLTFDTPPNSGDDGGYNVDCDIEVTGHQLLDRTSGQPTNLATTGGTVTITGCTFLGNIGVFDSGLTDGSFTLYGDSFTDGYIAFNSSEASASQFTVAHNQMWAGGSDVLVGQGGFATDGAGAPLPALPAPRYTITDNQISGGGPGYGAVILWDFCPYFDAAPRLDAALVGNDLDLSGGDGACGIAEFCTHDILCARNTFSGSASWGIYLGDDQDQNGHSVTVSGWRILGDDFSGLNASVAPILLGAGTTHNLVCPTPAGTIDNGVDNWLLDPLSANARGDLRAAAARPLAAPEKLKVIREMKLF
jgi:hypothetical protein